MPCVVGAAAAAAFLRLQLDEAAQGTEGGLVTATRAAITLLHSLLSLFGWLGRGGLKVKDISRQMIRFSRAARKKGEGNGGGARNEERNKVNHRSSFNQIALFTASSRQSPFYLHHNVTTAY